MSLKHALLGFLNYGPMTGYELKKFFDTSVAHFWSAELSQIYPTLKQLEKEGLVEMEVDVQSDRPNRKVYSITPGGRGELTDWLAQPSEIEQLREPLLVKVFFGSNLSRDELISLLQERIARLRDGTAYLDFAKQFIAAFTKSIDVEHEAPFWSLTVEAGLAHCQAEIAWAEGAIRTLQEQDDSCFGHSHGPEDHIHVQEALAVLERITSVMPVGASTMYGRKGETHESSNGRRARQKAPR